MSGLQIRLFGAPEVYFDGAPLSSFPTQRSQALFTFLVLHRDRLFHRDVLCGRFWGDQPDSEARKWLRTALWRIRSVVEPGDELRGAFLRVEGCQVGFPGTGEAWVDAGEFERLLARAEADGSQGMDEVEAARLVQALSLYRGDLLEGHYEDWCLEERERFRMAYLAALERLMDNRRKGHRWLDAISVGRQLLRSDPLREHIHRALMECHLAMGDRPSALRQYEACVHVLSEELQIEPMPETRRFLEGILAGESEPPESTPERNGRKDPEQRAARLAAEVDGALEVLHSLTERLERARTALRRSAPG